MNKAMSKADPGEYRAWKNQQSASKTEKELNPASFTEFPDLVKSAPKKTVFDGTSLATKLKEAIAAEEEEAIQKRLKKGVTPETILRELCVSLPLKGYKAPTEPLEVPSWVTDNTKPFIMPSFRPKSMKQMAEERRWRRLGINPFELSLNDTAQEDDDRVSLPSIHNEVELYDSEDESFVLQEELCQH